MDVHPKHQCSFPFIEASGDESLPPDKASLRANLRRESSLGSMGDSAYSSRSSQSGRSSLSLLCCNCQTLCPHCSRSTGPLHDMEVSKVKLEPESKMAVNMSISNNDGPGCKRCGYINFPLVTTTHGRSVKKLSPLHSYGKQQWIELLVDPKRTSLPMPTLPTIKEHRPCHRSSATRNLLKRVDTSAGLPGCARKARPSATNTRKPPSIRHQLPLLATNKFLHWAASSPPSSAPPPSQEGNTLPLVYNRRMQKRTDVVEPLPSSIFSQCPEPGGWYVVHPDWRMEPGIKGAW